MHSKIGVCVIALALVSLLPNCRPRRVATTAPGANAPGVSAICSNGATVREDPYIYENNEWGLGKAHGHFEQCLLERTARGNTQRGWAWDWPGTDSSVFAYPEIIFGWKPWSGGKTTDLRFPLRLSKMQDLTLEYEVETEASGSYNLAPEVWLIRERSGAGQANSSLISAEIMFWVEAAGVAQPGGTIVDHPLVNGVTYELWQQDGAGGSGSGPTWRLLSLKTPTTQRAGIIPIADLLRYLVKKGLVSADHYVASVEFGNEISGGRGTTWIKKFAVHVNP